MNIDGNKMSDYMAIQIGQLSKDNALLRTQLDMKNKEVEVLQKKLLSDKEK